MPSIVDLVAAISTAVVADLAAGGQLPLTSLSNGAAGAILVGKEHDYEQTDAPRIIFTPIKSEFGAKDLAAPSPLRPMTERVIGSDMTTFEVRCWGRGLADVTGGTSPAADIDATRALYQSVLSMIHATCVGCYEFGAGEWLDSSGKESLHVRRGREFVFKVTINTPIYARTARSNLASPVVSLDPPSNYVPSGTVRGETVTFNDATGTGGTVTIP